MPPPVARLLLTVLAMLPTSLTAADLEPIGTFAVEEDDFVYARVDGLELRAHSYRPASDGVEPLPAVVEVHGGAWNLYDRMAGAHYNRALASSGLHVMAVDFRQGPKHRHPLGSRDVTAAVRYLRANAGALAVDPARIGLIGSSSGGHLALLAGIKPDAAMHRGTPIRLPDGRYDLAEATSAAVTYVIGLWPVADPAYRYRYAQEVERKQLVRFHNNYFGDEATMQEASIARAVAAGEATGPLPALLIVQPGEDANVPRPMTFALIEAYQNAGGSLDYAFFPGQPHAFAHRPSAATDDCIRTMRSFIQRQLDASTPTR